MLKAAASKARLLIFFSSFLVLLVGVLLLRRGSITFGLAVIAVGLIAYLWSSAQLQKQSPSEEEMRAIKMPSVTGVFIFLSVACAVAVFFFITDTQPTSLIDRLANLFWILSMLFIVISGFWA